MAGYRKLSRTCRSEKSPDQKSGYSSACIMEKSLQQKQKAKEIRKVAEGLIALAVKRKRQL